MKNRDFPVPKMASRVDQVQRELFCNETTILQNDNDDVHKPPFKNKTKREMACLQS